MIIETFSFVSSYGYGDTMKILKYGNMNIIIVPAPIIFHAFYFFLTDGVFFLVRWGKETTTIGKFQLLCSSS